MNPSFRGIALFLALWTSTLIAAEGGCATAHPLATQACTGVLQQGGNAFDAAVATAATLAVVEPFGSGMGGGGFFLLHEAITDKDRFLDGRERAPLAASATMFTKAGVVVPELSRDGALAAAIPHQAALLSYTATQFGSRPLAELLEPAIIATEGVVVDVRLAKEIANHWPRMDANMRAVFGRNGTPLQAGQSLVQKDLGDTLQRFAANGIEEFTAGQTAKNLLKGVQAAGGIWQAQDLKTAAITERTPLRGYFRNYRVVTAPLPSAGGLAILQSLTMLEALQFSNLDSPLGVHQFVEVLRRAYRDRNAYLGDADYVPVPLDALLNRDALLTLAAGITEKATASASLPARFAGSEGGQTTHFSIIDSKGNRVAATLSLNLFFGAALMPASTGIVLNDQMDDFAASSTASNAYGLAGSAANAVAPGKRPLSSMSPTFIQGPNGVMVLGTPGGSRIPSMVLLAILRFVQGYTPAQVVAAKRIHHQWLPDVLSFEAGALSPQQQQDAAARGHVLKAITEPYGNLQIVVQAPNGRMQAGSDPRWIGLAQTVPTP